MAASTPELHGLLHEVLGPHLAENPRDPHPVRHYGVALGVAGSRPGQRPLHQLYWGSTVVLRTADLGRLVRALLSHLSAQAQAADANESRLLLPGLVTVSGACALIVPGTVNCDPMVGRHLARRGIPVVDAPWLPVDPELGELEVPEPSLEVEWRRVDELVAGFQASTSREPTVAWGRYPIAGWVFTTADGAPLSRAERLSRLASILVNRPSVPSFEALAHFAQLLQRTSQLTMPVERASELGARLAGLATSLPR